MKRAEYEDVLIILQKQYNFRVWIIEHYLKHPRNYNMQYNLSPHISL